MYSGDPFPIEQSSLYQEWQLEKLAIQELKWHMSEDAGHDVGWDRAYWVWVTTYRHTWRASFRQSGLMSLEPF